MLKIFCENNSTTFFTSVFNVDDINFLSSLDMDIVKIPSHEIHNVELIKVATDIFDTVLVSTGASKWTEMDSTLHFTSLHAQKTTKTSKNSQVWLQKCSFVHVW